MRCTASLMQLQRVANLSLLNGGALKVLGAIHWSTTAAISVH